MSHPFDAAIKCLRLVDEAQGDGVDAIDIGHIDASSFESAIRFLEAGKGVTDEDINRAIHGYVDEPVILLLEALDEALPDKEGGK